MDRKKTKANNGIPPRKKVAASVAKTAELPGESPVVKPLAEGLPQCLFVHL
jgi:hypothetical protein